MKNLLKNLRYKLPMLQLMLLSGIYAFAQDSGATTSTHTATSQSSSSTGPDNAAMWYSAPWVWAVGAVVLILIVYAIFKGSNNNNRTEVTRTTKTTTEVKND